jgi:hypothetical protein
MPDMSMIDDRTGMNEAEGELLSKTTLACHAGIGAPKRYWHENTRSLSAARPSTVTARPRARF